MNRNIFSCLSLTFCWGRCLVPWQFPHHLFFSFPFLCWKGERHPTKTERRPPLLSFPYLSFPFLSDPNTFRATGTERPEKNTLPSSIPPNGVTTWTRRWFLDPEIPPPSGVRSGGICCQIAEVEKHKKASAELLAAAAAVLSERSETKTRMGRKSENKKRSGNQKYWAWKIRLKKWASEDEQCHSAGCWLEFRFPLWLSERLAGFVAVFFFLGGHECIHVGPVAKVVNFITKAFKSDFPKRHHLHACSGTEFGIVF